MKKYIRRMIAAIMVVATLFGVVATVSAASFTDVQKGSWYYDAVNFVSNKGIMAGTGNGKFEPNTTMTRAMAVQILYALAGSPSASGTIPFKDVSTSAWYYNAVKWAYNNKIVSGTTSTTFSPAWNVTREQFATMLYQYDQKFQPYFYNVSEMLERYPQLKVKIKETFYGGLAFDDNMFSDSKKVSSWALEGMNWITSEIADYKIQQKTSTRHINIIGYAEYKAIMQGSDKKTVDPQKSMTRAECAQIIKAYYENNYQKTQSTRFAEAGIRTDLVNGQWQIWKFAYYYNRDGYENGYREYGPEPVDKPYFDDYPDAYIP